MAARKWAGVKIENTDWDDAVESIAIPLIASGDNRQVFNATTKRWEFYINGNKVMEVDENGYLYLKGEVQSLQTF
jgi:hypothetical protein